MNTKKYVISAGVVATMLMGFSSLVLAENMMSNAESMKIGEGKEMAVRAGTEMILQVNHRGKVLMRGTIESVGTGSIVVKSWGGSWTVNIGPDARLLPGTDISKFKAGDFVGVQGQVSETATFTIDAAIVRNWTVKKAEVENKVMERKERHNNQEEIRDVIKNESPKNWQGTASNINVSGNSLTLTIEGVAYTVNVVAGAKIVSQSFLTIGLADIKDGHIVRVWGPVSSTTISAYVVRDVSINP